MSEPLLKTGVIGSSAKENEWRLPLHPDHLPLLDDSVRARLWVEEGYAVRYGITDNHLRGLVAGVASREELLATSDLVIIPKPVREDLMCVRKGGVVFGWLHCVQQPQLTQVAVDRQLTLITWESMNSWHPDGEWDMHIFYRNNEIAGYAGVAHALSVMGRTGWYGRPLKSAGVIGSGSVARGAIIALQNRGVREIVMFGLTPAHLVPHMLQGVEYRELQPNADGCVSALRADGTRAPLLAHLADADIVVNGLLQDPDRPLVYMDEADSTRLRDGALIIDISCDAGMGFTFARPTTFDSPTFRVGGVTYYAVDHTPSYMWDSSTWEVSRAVMPYLTTVMRGPTGWEQDSTVSRAVEVREGRIINPSILSFQRRDPLYPHAVATIGPRAETHRG